MVQTFEMSWRSKLPHSSWSFIPLLAFDQAIYNPLHYSKLIAVQIIPAQSNVNYVQWNANASHHVEFASAMFFLPMCQLG